MWSGTLPKARSPSSNGYSYGSRVLLSSEFVCFDLARGPESTDVVMAAIWPFTGSISTDTRSFQIRDPNLFTAFEEPEKYHTPFLKARLWFLSSIFRDKVSPQFPNWPQTPGLWWVSALTSQLAGTLGMYHSCLELCLWAGSKTIMVKNKFTHWLGI